jgi:hypothetical protein
MLGVGKTVWRGEKKPMPSLSRRSLFKLFGYVSAALAGIASRSAAATEPDQYGPVFGGYPRFTPEPEWQDDEFKFYGGFDTLTLQGIPLILDGGFPMPEPGGDNAGRRQDD